MMFPPFPSLATPRNPYLSLNTNIFKKLIAPLSGEFKESNVDFNPKTFKIYLVSDEHRGDKTM